MLQDLKSNKAIIEDPNATLPTYGAENGLSLASLRSSEDNPVPYNDKKWDMLLDQMTFSEQALIVTNGAFHTDGCKSINKPETNEQDGPTGVSKSKNGLSFPSEGIWASSFDVEVIAKVGDALAEDAYDNGQTGMYLPGINIHRAPFGGRIHEYFSEDPFLTGIACEAEVKALQAKGVIAHVKHFAFNEEEDNRNGVCIWLNEQSAREIYLSPWEYAVKPSRGNAHAVMTSFNRAGNIWTSASSELLDDILRGEWGFDGYVITDMASSNGALYMVYSDGYMNGTDLCLGTGSASALDSYKSNATFANKIRESTHRILYVIANYSIAMNGWTADSEVVDIMPWWGTLLITFIVLSAVLTAASATMLVLSYLKTGKPQKN